MELTNLGEFFAQLLIGLCLVAIHLGFSNFKYYYIDSYKLKKLLKNIIKNNSQIGIDELKLAVKQIIRYNDFAFLERALEAIYTDYISKNDPLKDSVKKLIDALGFSRYYGIPSDISTELHKIESKVESKDYELFINKLKSFKFQPKGLSITTVIIHIFSFLGFFEFYNYYLPIFLSY